MPQLSINVGSDRNPVRFVAEYHVDPVEPDAEAELTIRSVNGQGDWIDFAYLRVPGEVVHEMVVDLLRASWEAWLFGEPGSIRKVCGVIKTAWREEAAARRS